MILVGLFLYPTADQDKKEDGGCQNRHPEYFFPIFMHREHGYDTAADQRRNRQPDPRRPEHENGSADTGCRQQAQMPLTFQYP